jgi:hypothetical protein
MDMERDPVLDAELAALGIVEGTYDDEPPVEITTLVDPGREPDDEPVAEITPYRYGLSSVPAEESRWKVELLEPDVGGWRVTGTLWIDENGDVQADSDDVLRSIRTLRVPPRLPPLDPGERPLSIDDGERWLRCVPLYFWLRSNPYCSARFVEEPVARPTSPPPS